MAQVPCYLIVGNGCVSPRHFQYHFLLLSLVPTIPITLGLPYFTITFRVAVLYSFSTYQRGMTHECIRFFL